VTVLKLGDVLPRIAERLAERARQGGMELVVDVPAEVSGQPLRTNALALEQILFNLVDNACKYAAGAADRRIHLSGVGHDAVDTVCLDVRDHGPGVAPALAKRLFHPFSKSVQEAANTAPGLGLGLSLSRRLARSMGGDLRLDESYPKQEGTRLILSLPRA
jgi:C4-dicarboxylate-specific signal transduction histidine kinase